MNVGERLRAALRRSSGRRRGKKALDQPDGLAPALALARLDRERRRTRNGLFRAPIFGEPAWDILLELFIAVDEERHLLKYDLCGRVYLSYPTVVRWLHTLTSSQLVEWDRRQGTVRLTQRAMHGLIAYYVQPQAPSGEDRKRHAPASPIKN